MPRKSMLRPPHPQHVITADASGTWGCGASGGLVPASVAPVMGGTPHCGQGIGPCSHGSGSVGSQLQSTAQFAPQVQGRSSSSRMGHC